MDVFLAPLNARSCYCVQLVGACCIKCNLGYFLDVTVLERVHSSIKNACRQMGFIYEFSQPDIHQTSARFDPCNAKMLAVPAVLSVQAGLPSYFGRMPHLSRKLVT